MPRTSSKKGRVIIGTEKVSKKMGRPLKAEEGRTAQLHIRLTPSEVERIDQCRKALNMTATEALLYGISLIENQIKE